jgi:acetyl-CoA acetyltransferase
MALDDAGIAPAEVDGLSSYTLEPFREVDVARAVGLGDITFFTQVGFGGGAGCGVVGHAAMAVAAGQCTTAVAWRARKRADRASRPWSQAPSRLADTSQWTRPFGILRPVDEIALLTRRYMHEYGATREHLANVAVAFRKHAARNPASTMGHKTLTHDDYMNARWISEPLCLFDNCLETDGALAVVVTSAVRARDLRQPPA